MVADKSRGRPHTFLGHILVLRDVLALVLTLFLNSAQVLLVVVDLIERHIVVAHESEPSKNAHGVGNQLDVASSQEPATDTHRSVSRVTDEDDFDSYGKDKTKGKKENHTRHQNGHRSRVLLPLLPFRCIEAPKFWELGVKLSDRVSEAPRSVPGPLEG